MICFSNWFVQRHGYPPFPWQEALANRIAAGDWPTAVVAPTGCGKTGVMDAWLWTRLHGHPVPRRLIYVIDRRLVVDGVTNYAEGLAASLPPDQRPKVIALRGGITIDQDWVSEPTRPSILVSTVDQAGSRLLFCGYGVSRRTAPIHAALLGNDALWVLDEVHLAQPLLQTLQTVAQMRGDAIDLPLRVLPMSATWAGANTLGLRDADRNHTLLAPRLNRAKPASLVKIHADADLAPALADEARALKRDGSGVVAVVCNRVATARATFEHLREGADAVLLTGRIRPADKSRLMAEYLPRMGTGTRAQGRAPLFVVSTQTIEVGADLDFDALVTEAAPLSALRQRAGRLNRMGELPFAPMTIVYRAVTNDPVYGDGIKAAWEWLGKVAKRKMVDFGIAAMDVAMTGRAPRGALTRDAASAAFACGRFGAHQHSARDRRGTVATRLATQRRRCPSVLACRLDSRERASRATAPAGVAAGSPVGGASVVGRHRGRRS